MRKISPLILIVFIFFPALLYLHQKVQIYVEAYRLSESHRCHNELVDKRDHLMYNFSKEVSVGRVNQWMGLRNFAPVEKERILILGQQPQMQASNDNKIISLVDRFLKASTSTPMALAEEKE